MKRFQKIIYPILSIGTVASMTQQAVADRPIVVKASKNDQVKKEENIVEVVIKKKDGGNETIQAVFEDEISERVFEQINMIRKENGKKELKKNKDLISAVQKRVLEASKHYSHSRPDGSDFNTASPKAKDGYNYTAHGEILMKLNNKDNELNRIVSGWMKSTPHKALILSGDFKSSEVRVYRDVNTGHLYAAQLFSYFE